jgi:hypothetical protein
MTYITHALRIAAVAALAMPLAPASDVSTSARSEPVLTARHMNKGASLKVFNPTGAVRLVGWDHDSLEVRGAVSPRKRYYEAGDANGAKVGMEESGANEVPAQGDLIVFVPRGTQASVKTANGNIDASDISGWFYAIGGGVHIRGTAASIEVDAMRGDVEISAAVPWLHVRAGAGHVTVHGAVTDADVTTIGGALDIAGAGIMRGQFSSVTGDIRWSGPPAMKAILDFSNHSGAIEFALPPSTVATLLLSTVTGTISNGFAQIHPVSQAERSVRVTFGHSGADVTARTFKGAIRMKPM